MNLWANIRWVRVIVGAVVVEVLLLGIAIPLNMSPAGQALLMKIVIPMCVVASFLGGWWVARRAESAFLVHGLLLGVIATLIYGMLTVKVALPVSYLVANYLKMPAGAAGGLMAGFQLLRRRPPT